MNEVLFDELKYFRKQANEIIRNRPDFFKEKKPELDKNGDSNRTPFSDSENISKYPLGALYKPVDAIIQENTLYFEKLKNVKNIFVLGHGLDVVDIPYFKEILKHTKNTVWNVSFFSKMRKKNISQLYKTLVLIKIQLQCSN